MWATAPAAIKFPAPRPPGPNGCDAQIWRPLAARQKGLPRFAALVLSGPTNLWAMTGQLSELVCEACWRLIKLLEYIYDELAYWKGLAGIKNLSAMAGFSKEVARAWLKKKAIWQICLPAKRHIPHSKFDVSVPNDPS